MGGGHLVPGKSSFNLSFDSALEPQVKGICADLGSMSQAECLKSDGRTHLRTSDGMYQYTPDGFAGNIAFYWTSPLLVFANCPVPTMIDYIMSWIHVIVLI